MKILRFSTLICVVTILLACQQQKSYTFVQYNVGAFSKYDGSSVDAVASAVKEMKADVVSLNELDSCTTRTGCVDQLAEFAAAMGDWNHQFGAAIPYKGGAYGVGVASPSLHMLRTDV